MLSSIDIIFDVKEKTLSVDVVTYYMTSDTRFTSKKIEDPEMIEKMRKRLSKRQFAQEFLNHFSDDDFRLFTDEWIEKVCILKRIYAFLRKNLILLL